MTRQVRRVGDMHPRRELIVLEQDDGDMIVAIAESGVVIEGDDLGPWGDDARAEVEFCSIGSGGGRSPATRDALLRLLKAIEEDNAAHPIEIRE